MRASRGAWGEEKETQLWQLDLPLIYLYEVPGLSLILKWPSGFAYATQTGGFACLQSWAEGILLPLGPRGQERLDERFGEGRTKYDGYCWNGIDADDADWLDFVLTHLEPGHNWGPLITVDRSRLADSWEAWVHVRIGPHPEREPAPPGGDSWPFHGIPAQEAILTWENSD